MLGAIAGDLIGSVHEFVATKTTDFPLFVAKASSLTTRFLPFEWRTAC